jgi:hypothetical protein
MISEEKMIHVVHLILDGLEKGGLVSYTNKDETVREAKKICLLHLKQMSNVADIARARILSQKNPPLEKTSQWENLYAKYYEEEMRKKGG